MPAKQDEACEVEETEEALDVILPSGDEPTEVMQPGDEALHLPAFSVAPQRTAVLSLASAAPITSPRSNRRPNSRRIR